MSQAQLIPPRSTEPGTPPSWFAVRTRSNHERAACDRLVVKGVEAYLPTLLVRSRRRDRRSVVTRPLFPGYFFARLRLEHTHRVEVLKAPGVMHLVGFGGGPVVVPDAQVESIRITLEAKNHAELLWRVVRGQKVRIVSGALAGAEGVVVNDASGSHRLVISLDLLGRSLSVEVSPEDLMPQS